METDMMTQRRRICVVSNHLSIAMSLSNFSFPFWDDNEAERMRKKEKLFL